MHRLASTSISTRHPSSHAEEAWLRRHCGTKSVHPEGVTPYARSCQERKNPYYPSLKTAGETWLGGQRSPCSRRVSCSVGGARATLTAGTTFTHWIADHNVLWRSPLTPAALEQSIRYYTLIGSGPPLLGWVYVGLVGLAIAAATAKLVSGWRGRSGEVLFDGASLCTLDGRGMLIPVLILSITYNQATEVFPST